MELNGPPRRSLEDSGVKGCVDYAGPAEEVSAGINIGTISVIFGRYVASCPLSISHCVMW